MIRHITLLRFRDGFPVEERERWLRGLDALADEIPVILGLTHGPDAGLAAGQRSADYAIVAEFATAADVAAYYMHPAHDRLKDISVPNADLMVTVDLID
ncbi:Dabb family protein [Microbacterium sp. KRD172]|uniref:Dabb family protein n=1 Tax=Microbacterium sp. KRD172 TaxID=2729727 RepID=UPI0019D1819F|nr:Dabb family protein [Microbacterium sp. KRD172]